jgi:hypothetical protein
MSLANDILLAQRQSDLNAARAVVASLQPPEAAAAGNAASIAWGKAWGYWKNNAGNNSYVECCPCDDRAGANPQTGTSIRLYLPRNPGCDPNVVPDQVVGYVADVTGTKIAVAGYLDAAIGTVRMWSKTGALPPGWVDCGPGLASPSVQYLAGSFPVCLKAGDSDFGTLGNHGNQGRKTHAHNMEQENTEPPADVVYLFEGTMDTTFIGTGLANHLPPWCVVRFIERINNSVN